MLETLERGIHGYFPFPERHPRRLRRDSEARRTSYRGDYFDDWLTDEIDEAINEILADFEGVDEFLTARQMSRAVERNRALATQLGWQPHYDAIVRLLASTGCLQPNYSPGGEDLSEAVACWQQGQGLTADGIIGRNTWRRMQIALGIARQSPATSSVPRPPGGAARTSYFRDDSSLRTISLSPTTPITIDPRWPQLRKNLASTYNRLGGLIQTLANRVRIEIPAVLAVWQVESAGRRHVPGRAIIRFENHLFYRLWGRRNPTIYDRYFRHGGQAGQPGRSWQNHQFRERINEPFRSFHGNQDLEYRVLFLAQQLGGETSALQSISIGGSQILVSNYRMLGYTSPREMYEVFQSSECFHVLGFFDFCTHHPQGDLLRYLRNREWSSFAYYYNGSGKADEYGQAIQRAYQEGRQLSLY